MQFGMDFKIIRGALNGLSTVEYSAIGRAFTACIDPIRSLNQEYPVHFP